MTIAEMLGQNVILTALGMTVVFVFLWLMVMCVDAVAWVIRKTGLGRPPAGAPKKTAKQEEVTAAITAALTEYRKKEKAGNE